MSIPDVEAAVDSGQFGDTCCNRLSRSESHAETISDERGQWASMFSEEPVLVGLYSSGLVCLRVARPLLDILA